MNTRVRGVKINKGTYREVAGSTLAGFRKDATRAGSGFFHEIRKCMGDLF
jgi:hypothetical protein